MYASRKFFLFYQQVSDQKATEHEKEIHAKVAVPEKEFQNIIHPW